MAHLLKSEYADKCGVSRAYVSTNIKRGKIRVRKDGKVDDSDPVNVQFFDRVQANKNKSNSDAVAKDQKSDNIYDLNTILKKKDIQKREQEVEKLRLQVAKLSGEMIPTEMAAQTIAQFSHEMMAASKIMMERTLLEWSKRKKFSRAEVAELKKLMINELNRMNETAVEEAKTSIADQVKELVETRGRGERN